MDSDQLQEPDVCDSKADSSSDVFSKLSSSSADSSGQPRLDEEEEGCSSGFVSGSDQDVLRSPESATVSFLSRSEVIPTTRSTVTFDELSTRHDSLSSYRRHSDYSIASSQRFHSPPFSRRSVSQEAKLGGSLPPSPVIPHRGHDLPSPLASNGGTDFSKTSSCSTNNTSSRGNHPPSCSATSHQAAFGDDSPRCVPKTNSKRHKLAQRRKTVLATTASVYQSSRHNSLSTRLPSAADEKPSSPELGLKNSTKSHGPKRLLSPTLSRSATRSSQDPGRSFYSRIHVFEVSFCLPTGDNVKLQCPGNKTVGEIKDMLWDTMKENQILDYHPGLVDSSQYALKYKKFGTDYELYDQEQLFQTLSIVSYWQTKRQADPEFRVEIKRPENEEARKFQVLINDLIGVDMQHLIQNSNTDEADITRRKLISARHAAVSSRDDELYAMEPALTHSEVPDTIRKACAEPWIGINVQFEEKKDLAQEILFQVSETPLDLLQFLFSPESGKRALLGIPDDVEARDYTLKMCGKDSYLYCGHVFLQYTYIRRCLLKKQPIHLAVVKKPDIAADAVPRYGEPDFIDECCNLTGSHQQLSALTKDHSEVFTMSLWDIKTPFVVKIVGLDRMLDTSSWNTLYLEIGLYHGGHLLCPAKGTSSLTVAGDTVFVNQTFKFEIAVCNIPKAARLHFVIYGGKKSSTLRRASAPYVASTPPVSPNLLSVPENAPQPSPSPTAKRRWFNLRPKTSPKLGRRDAITELATGVDVMDIVEQVDGNERPEAREPLLWVNFQLLDHRAVLRTGSQQLSMWQIPVVNGERDTSKFSPNGCASENPNTHRAAILRLELDEYAHRVACPTAGLGQEVSDSSGVDLNSAENEEGVRSPGKKILRDCLEEAMSILDPLKPLTRQEKDLLWNFRDVCRKRPEALPRFLQALCWADKNHVLEVHRLLVSWAPLTIEVALQLLDYHFADEEVRRLAVTRLEKLESDDLLTFLLQLVQCLKFEAYHDSSLAHFLLGRALRSKRIGHNFFWFLRAEMDTPEYRERFGLLLEAYLRGCGQHMLDIIHHQHRVNAFLKMASSLVKEEKLELRAATLQKLLSTSDVLKEDLRPVYDSSLVIGGLALEKCKVMDSKKAPLWLEFVNKDPTNRSHDPVKVIFKLGDDLRQDMLTLQMINLMDKLWQDNGLDLFMLPYGCMSTGHELGMIQVVLNSETVASIQRKRGGDLLSNARASFTDETLATWLKEKQSSHSEHVQAVRRFVLSCAGYCVATYVLGIGDRHNDNIMITKSGNLFHIDFGHFLGNTKKFLGGLVNRERAPFVLTPDFVHIMGKKDSSNFQDFVGIACRAYNIIRKHAHLFINLFSMMKRTGIPELTCIEDIDYLRNVLLLNKTDEEAAEHFTRQVERCLELAWTVRVNFVAHNVKRR